MLATAKYQSPRGYFLQASYVLSRSIDDNSAFFGSTGETGGVADANHIDLERGPSSFDTRHHASILYGMDVPAGPGHRVFGWNNGFSPQVFGGWNVSGLLTAQTGQPFTVYDTSQDYSGFNQFFDRPDVITTGRCPKTTEIRITHSAPQARGAGSVTFRIRLPPAASEPPAGTNSMDRDCSTGAWLPPKPSPSGKNVPGCSSGPISSISSTTPISPSRFMTKAMPISERSRKPSAPRWRLRWAPWGSLRRDRWRRPRKRSAASPTSTRLDARGDRTYQVLPPGARRERNRNSATL
jgi:hypothetical protein